MGRIWLISGGRGAGKTTLCAAVIGRAQAAGWDVAGLLSPAVVTGGRKTAIAALDLRRGERRLLARARAAAAGEQDGESPIRTRAWSFDPAVLAWGDRVLQAAVPCDLLVVDELGTLEFERGQGWLSGLAALDSGRYRQALAVIRPELLAAAQARWPAAQLVAVSAVDDRQALALAGQILGGLSA